MTPAQQLTGQELDAWLNAAEDRLFEAGLQDLRAMKQERERGYRVAALPGVVPGAVL